jgi:hypothetical protein
MIDHWQWIALSALSLLAIYEEVCVYRIRLASKKREELFQIVTENAADMIALVDVKGKSPLQQPRL